MVFDIMGKLFSRISILEKDATGESMARCLSHTPEFVKTVVNRAVITNPNILVSNKISMRSLALILIRIILILSISL